MMHPEDWIGLAPERDRPTGPEFDWAPEALNLTAAAVLVVRHHRDYDVDEAAGAYQTFRLVIALWSELCGMDEAASLVYAYSIADAVPPVMGTVPPF